jgi:hypothetical protein
MPAQVAMHSLRYTMASRLLEAGIPLETTQVSWDTFPSTQSPYSNLFDRKRTKGPGNVPGFRSRDYNARFTATHRTVSVYRVLQMRGVRVRRRTPCTSCPDYKADAVPCERLPGM